MKDFFEFLIECWDINAEVHTKTACVRWTAIATIIWYMVYIICSCLPTEWKSYTNEFASCHNAALKSIKNLLASSVNSEYFYRAIVIMLGHKHLRRTFFRQLTRRLLNEGCRGKTSVTWSNWNYIENCV